MSMAAITRDDVICMALDAMQEKNLTFDALAGLLGRQTFWVAAALYGRMGLAEDEAARIVDILDLDPGCGVLLRENPSRDHSR